MDKTTERFYLTKENEREFVESHEGYADSEREEFRRYVRDNYPDYEDKINWEDI